MFYFLQHFTVNYTLDFDNQLTGIHTQNIECTETHSKKL